MRSLTALLLLLFPAVLSAADTDADGLDDAWELSSFGDLSKAAYDDTDGDRIPNLWEAAWGTDGAASASKPSVAGAGPAGTGGYYVADPAMTGVETAYAKKSFQAGILAATDLGIIEAKPGLHGNTNWVIPNGKRLLIFSPVGPLKTLCYWGGTTQSPSVIDGIGWDYRLAGGGGVYVTLQSYGARLRNCVMRGVTSGVEVDYYPNGSGSSLLGPTVLEHCLITGNAYGIYRDYSYPLTAVNCIVTGNSSADSFNANSQIIFQSCAVGEGKTAGATVDAQCLRLDPAAASPVLPVINTLGMNGNYGLFSSSPLINRGRVLTGAVIDLDGEIRANSAADLPDIGTDEFSDSDLDGLPNSWELAFPADAAPADDSDGDTANALAEYLAGTFPTDTDSDNDSLSDGWEIAHASNPTIPDTQPDTDGDRFPNAWEAAFGTDGADPVSRPVWSETQTGARKYYVVDQTLAADTAYAKRTIMAAITAAASLDIIEVKPGTYSENPNDSGKALLIFSQAGAKLTTVSSSSEPTFSGNTIIDGFRFRRNGGSQGILTQGGEVWIKNCIVTGATYGIWINGGTGRIIHCTVTGNSSYGVFQGNSRPIEIINSIVWGNGTADLQGNSGVTIRKSLAGQGKTGSVALGAGMVLLPSGQTPQWNPAFELLAGSPAIGAGEVRPAREWDMHGEARTNNATDLPDMGADEFLDADTDQLPDWAEALAGEPADDSDNDGASNLTEYLAASNILDADTDKDSLKDGYELANALNPLVADVWSDNDGDRFPNMWEYAFGTDGAQDSSKPVWSETQTGARKYYVVDQTLAADTAYAKRTIVAAITAAASLDIIEVKPGTYSENPNDSGKALLIFSQAGAKLTTVSSSSEPTFSGNTIIDGFRFRRNGGSQGILTQGGEVWIKNCIVTGATYGIWINGGTGRIIHCTVTGNSSYGVFQGNSRPIEIINSIVWGNGTADLQGNSGVTIRKSLAGQGKTGSVALGAGMVLLPSGQTPQWNPAFELLAGSPAIGAGEVRPAREWDMHGEARTNNATDLPDMGADEYFDADSDGLPDVWEARYAGSADPAGDEDSDGASALAEYNAGSDPTDADTDNDALKDGWELANAHNLLVSDGEEDTDGDRFPNHWENAFGSDGADAGSRPEWAAAQSGTPGYVRVDGTLANDSAAWEKRTISAAVNAAGNFGIVEVRPGTYGGVSVPSGKRLLIYSTAGAGATVISQTGSSALTLSSMSVVDGFGLRNSSTGVALHSGSGGSELRNCVIGGNGTGVQITGSNATYVRYIHCTVSGNSTGLYHNYFGLQTRVQNSIIAGNSSADIQYADSTTQVTYSAVGTYLNGTPALGAGVIRIDPAATGANPAIVASAGLTPDLHLKATSPLINKGTAGTSYNSAEMDGELRVNNATDLPDMGADEYFDADSDGLPDVWEARYAGSADPAGDEDSDGASALAEYNAGSDPTDADTDNDALKDGWELANAHNLLVSDGEEDTDGDRFPNHWENAFGSDGADAGSRPEWAAAQSGTPGYVRVDGTLANDSAAWEKRTISAAVSAAGNFGIVEVRPGTYGAVSVPSGKRLLIFSTAGAGATVISQTGSSALTLSSMSVVDGFGLRNSSTGVALHSGSGGSELRNCVIGGNGTGVQITGSNATYVRYIHCTVSGNSTGLYHNYFGLQTRVQNSIIAGNSSADIQYADSTTQVTYSAVGTYLNGTPALGAGVIRIDPAATGANPAIVASAGLTPDLHLKATSPLINKGTAGTSYNSAEMDGELRVNNATDLPDMGADEYFDADSDGLPDVWEARYAGSADPAGDEDSDGASALAEYNAGSDPTDADTDNDALKDGWELANAHNLLVSDGEEDTDGDRFPNHWENAFGSDGADAGSRPAWAAAQSGTPGYVRVDGTLANDSAAWEKRTISAAVNAAGNFGIVEVRPGTYGGVSVPSGKRLLIYSTAGAGATVISQTGSSALTLSSMSVVDGFGLRNSSTGVALHSGSGGSELRNCVIGGNGTGVQITGSNATYVRYIHCTVSGNSTGLYHNYFGLQTRVQNSIIAGNSSADIQYADSTTQVTYSAVGTYLNGTPALGAGVIRIDPAATGANPAIVASAGLTADFHLLGSSPLINKGAVLPNFGGLDLDGRTRRNAPDDLPDMGADEVDDADSDQLADWWEQLYFGNLASLATDDGDADGLTNLQEQNAATNPTLADTDADGMNDGAEVAAGLNPLLKNKVAPITLSHAADLYREPITLTLSCATAGAEIRYTTDGSTPTASSALYVSPLPVAEALNLRAQAFYLSYTPSDAVAAGYRVDSAATFPLGSVALWLRADRGVTLDGANRIAAWQDLSGAGHHFQQSTASRRPVIRPNLHGGRPAAGFDGIDDFLRFPAVKRFSSSGFTMVALSRSPAVTGTEDVLLSYAGASTTPEIQVRVHSPARAIALERRSASALSLLTRPERFPDGFDVTSLTWNAADGAHVHYADGTAAGSAVLNASAGAIPAGGSLALGSAHSGNNLTTSFTNAAQWDLAEILIYSRVLTAAEIAELQSYFDTAYGINVARPVASPSQGLYQNSVSVTLACATEGAAIYYSTDGSEPTESSAAYAAPVTINTSGLTTLKARAFLAGANPSSVASWDYTIDTAPPVVTDPRLAGVALASGTGITSGGLLSVAATDAGGISRVEFFMDGLLLGSDGTSTDGYTFPLHLDGAAEDGPHTITFRAFDSFGTSTSLDIPVTLTLAAPSAPLLVTPAADYATPETAVPVAGTAVAGARINVYRGSTLALSGLAPDAAGQWSAMIPLDDGANVITARAYYRPAQLSASSAARTVTLDGDRPQAPLGLLAEAISGGRIRLSWNPAAIPDLAGYRVYRASSSFTEIANATLLTVSAITVPGYTDSPASGVTGPLFYRIATVDTAGNASPLSAEVQATPDAAGPSAVIAVTAGSAAWDAERGRFGPGSIQVSLTPSEALGRPPVVVIKSPQTGAALQPVNLTLAQEAAGPVYRGTFTPGAGWASGEASFFFTGYDGAGNLGSQITSGATVYLDHAAPAVTALDLPPVVKNSSSEPVTLTLHATLDEATWDTATPPAVTPPAFTYTLSRTQTTPVPVTSVSAGQDDLHWTVTLTLPDGAGAEPEFLQLAINARDSLGNSGGTFSGLDPVSEIYQGTLTTPPAPAGLTATPHPAGAIALAWQAVEKASAYRIHRGTQADGSDLTVVATTENGTTLTLTDTPASDGTWFYAVETIRTHLDATAYSGRSPVIVSADSDRVAPDAPGDFDVALQPAGVQLSWTPVPDAATYSVWRSATAITSTGALTAYQIDITQSSTRDSSPRSDQPHYSVTAVDAAGNVSLPATSQRLNVDLLPVSALTFVQTDDQPPVIGWNALSGAIAGYRLAIGPPATAQPVNGGSLITGTSYTDSAYTSGEQSYSVTVVDSAGDTSLTRTLSVPSATYALTNPAAVLRRGLLNRLAFTLTNHSDSPITRARLSTTLDQAPYTSAWTAIPAGGTANVDLVIPGSLSLPDGTFNLPVSFVIEPNPGESITRSRDIALPVQPHALIAEVRPADFTFGGLGKLRFALTNTSTEPVEIVSAVNAGTDPSPDLRVRLEDGSGNRLGEAAVKIATGESIFLLTDGRTSVIRIAAGATYVSPIVTLPVPATAPAQAWAALEGDRTFFHKGQTDQVELAVPFRARRQVDLTDTAYSATLAAAAVNGRDVTFTGTATWKADNAPVSRGLVKLHILRHGAEFLQDITTQQDGTFSWAYHHPENQPGGIFTAWATHPDRLDRLDGINFTVHGAQITPGRARISTPRSYPQPMTFSVSAAQGTDLTSVSLTLDAADQPGGILPAGLSLTGQTPIATLAGGTTANLDASLLGDHTAPASGTLVARLMGTLAGSTGPQVWQKVVFEYNLSTAVPLLTAAPRSVDTGVNPGAETVESVTFTNTGYTTLLAPRVTLLNFDGTAAPSWAVLTTAGQPGDLAIGAATTAQISLAPPAGTASAQHVLRLRVAGDNFPAYDIPVTIAVTDAGSGSIQLYVYDQFSAADSSGNLLNGVTGARATLTHATVPSITHSSSAGANGFIHFTDIAVGRYQARITGPNHDPVTRTLWVRPGATISEEVALSYKAVSFEWSVNETEIVDRYEVKLNITYETDLLAANVIANPPSVTVPEMQQGEILQGEVAFTNVGQIRANDITYTLPESNSVIQIEWTGAIPGTLESGESVRVPYRITKTGGGASSPGGGDGGDDGDGGTGGTTGEGSSGGGVTRPCGQTPGVTVCGGLSYRYFCSNGRWFAAAVPFCVYVPGTGYPCPGAGGFFGGGGGGGGGGGIISAPASSSLFADACFPLGLLGAGPGGPGGDCKKDGVDTSSSSQTEPGGSWVDTVLREYQDVRHDLMIPSRHGDIMLTRAYFGNKWQWAHDRKLTAVRSADNLSYRSITRNRVVHERQGTQAQAWYHGGEIVEQLPDGRFKWSAPDGLWELYSGSGYLLQSGFRGDIVFVITWSDPSAVESGPLSSSETVSGGGVSAPPVYAVSIGDPAGNGKILLNTEHVAGGTRLVSAVTSLPGLSPGDNHSVTYTYHAGSGLLASITDPAGLTDSYTYDAEGRITSHVSPSQTVKNIDYHAAGGVSRVTGWEGGDREFGYSYDSVSREFYSIVRKAGGSVIESWYGENGKLLRSRQNGAAATVTGGNAQPALPDVASAVRAVGTEQGTDAGPGGITTTHHDAIGHIVYRRYADGTEFAQSLSGPENYFQPVWQRERSGLLITYEYDADHRLVKRRESLSRVELASVPALAASMPAGTYAEKVWSYYPAASGENAGLLQSATGPDGRTRIYEYTGGASAPQAPGRISRITETGSEAWPLLYTYDGFGRILSETDPLGHTTMWTYDAAGRIQTITSPLGIKTINTWDGERLASVESGREGSQPGRVTDFEYDGRNRLIARYRRAAPGAPRQLVMQISYDVEDRITETRDALGHPSRYLYDAQGQLVQRTEQGPHGELISTSTVSPDGTWRTDTTRTGLVSRMTMDSARRPVSVVEAEGTPWERRREYEYDGYGMLAAIRVTAPGVAEPATLTMSYTADGQLLSSGGNLVPGSTNAYYPDGRLHTMTDAAGAVTTYTYEDFPGVRRATVHLPPVHGAPYDISIQDYDMAENLIASRSAAGVWEQYAYDADGRLTAVSLPSLTLRPGAWWTDTASIARQVTYNRFGQILTEFTAAAGTTTYAYDGFGRQTSVTNATGYTVTRNYDALDRLTVVQYPSPDGSSTAHEIYSWHPSAPAFLLSRTTRTGQTISYEYDSAGRILKTIDPSGAASTLTYDGLSRPASLTLQPAGGADAPRTTLFTYNHLDAITQIQQPDHTAGVPRLIQRTYDAGGRMLTESAPGRVPVAYTYDAAGRVLTMAGGGNAPSSFTYDARGRTTRRTWPDQSHYDYTYTPDGLIATRTDARGHTAAYDYNAFRSINSIVYANDPGVTWTHDATGRPLTMTDATGVTAWDWDAAGRLTAERSSATGREVRYGYLAEGTMEEISIWNLTGAEPVQERLIQHAFDAAGQLSALTDSAISSAPFIYGRDSRFGSVSSIVNPRGQTTAFARDSLGQTIGITATGASGQTIWAGSYTYDAAFRRLTETTLLGGTSTYSRDAAGRLASVTRTASSLPSESYTQDASGNRLASADGVLAAAFQPNLLNQITQIGALAQEYDANGNQTRLREPGGRDLSLSWCDADRLIHAHDASSGHVSEWAYDAMGRRIEERCYSGPASSDPVSVTRTVYAGMLPVATLTADAPGTQAQNGATHHLSTLTATAFRTAEAIAWGADLSGTYGALQGTGGLLATRTFAADGSPQQALYYTSDALGHITAITDDQDNVRATYAYSAYGRVLAQTGDLAASNRWRYTSKSTDLWTTGFSEFGYRWYDPATGRWLSRDPMGEAGGFNLYEHNYGDPSMYADPDGQFGILGALAGGLIGGTINAAVAWWNDEDVGDAFLEGAVRGALVGSFVGLVPGAAIGLSAGRLFAMRVVMGAIGDFAGQTIAYEAGWRKCEPSILEAVVGSLTGEILAPVIRGVAAAIGAASRAAGRAINAALAKAANLARNIADDILGRYPRLNPMNYGWKQWLKDYSKQLRTQFNSGPPLPNSLPKFIPPKPTAARTTVTPEIYQASLRRFNTPNTTAAGRWEIANTGRYNYTVTGGGTTLDVDGIIGTTIQEAKFISKPGSSPFIPGSNIPDFLRTKIVGQVDDEFARMSRIIADPSNPLRDVEVIINNPAAERFFLDMLKKHGLNGRVIIR